VDPTVSQGTARAAVEAIWRIEAGRLVAGLARITQDVGLAEEFAQDALVAALDQWPRTGVPPNPGGWLMTVAKNRAVDAHRRHLVHLRAVERIGRAPEATEQREPDLEDTLDDHIGDDVLRLVFTACHPSLSMDSRVALVLRCLGGLSTEEIARAFLIPEATAAQRIVRAKRKLAELNVPFALPAPHEMAERLASVLEVVYLIFNEGYSATAGQDWTRPELCHEALRLGRLLAGLVPHEPEVHGLLALMELQASRLGSRNGPDGTPLPLADQDRRTWDRLLIRRGLASLARAENLDTPVGPYTLQAAIAACHARAASAADTDWERIVALYTVLGHVWPNPVVTLNHAVAVAMAGRPADALLMIDEIASRGALNGYPHLAAVRGDILARLGRRSEAAAEFRHAAAETRNDHEKALFVARADALGEPEPPIIGLR
jgi:RNA polymerase sigma factor (sigma-70 family)